MIENKYQIIKEAKEAAKDLEFVSREPLEFRNQLKI